MLCEEDWTVVRVGVMYNEPPIDVKVSCKLNVLLLLFV